MIRIAALKKRVEREFRKADVVLFGPDQSLPEGAWDIRVNDSAFYLSVVARGHDGFADGYVKGYWDCGRIDLCVRRLIETRVLDSRRLTLGNLRRYLSLKFFNMQRIPRARGNVERHYNLGPVFEVMLDPTMAYSCGYWRDARDLNGAQVAKLDLVCKKLGLGEDLDFCDIGCGWGSLLRHAASRYRCRAIGITLSTDQARHIASLERDSPSIPGLVEVRVEDYRELRGLYPRIASIGMFEHVGHRNYRTFMLAVYRVLAEQGLFLLHTFGAVDSSPTMRQPEVAWIDRHIFPGIELPSLGQICTAADGLFTIFDVHNIGPYYHPTLIAWASNFERGWSKISHLYPEHFYRMWRYYLYCCAGAFASGKFPLWQILMGKGNRWPKIPETIR